MSAPHTPLYNLTPHDIHLCDDDGQVRLTVPASGHVVRVGSKPQKVVETLKTPDGDIPVVFPPSYTRCEGLPVEAKGHDLIVSWLCGDQLLKEQPDYPHRVLNPDTGPDSVVRDDKGRIVGVRRLVLMNPSGASTTS